MVSQKWHVPSLDQMKTRSLIAALSLLSSSFCLAGGEGWTSDFEAAKAQAKKENKGLIAVCNIYA